jgi:restriction endonuclease S subunit
MQRRIASILGAYDALIEVNRLRMEVLEEMARRLATVDQSQDQQEHDGSDERVDYQGDVQSRHL